MASIALQAWQTSRTARLDRLQSAHPTVGGAGPGRRWLTEELNHALILRLRLAAHTALGPALAQYGSTVEGLGR